MFDSIKVNSEKDYQFYAHIIRFIGEAGFGENGEIFIKEAKQAMRKWANKPIKEIYTVLDQSDYGHMICRYPLPEYLKTEEDAKEYFEEMEYLYYRPSPYDCTGQIFTNWYKVYKHHGRFWVYHSTSMDI